MEVFNLLSIHITVWNLISSANLAPIEFTY